MLAPADPRHVVRHLVIGMAVAALAAKAVSAERTAPPEVQRLIAAAGNADEDQARLEILRRLSRRDDLDARLDAELGRLIAEVDRWVHSTYLPYFSRAISRNLDYDFGVAPDSPLYPLTSIYRGRMLVWMTLESGNIIRYHERRRQFLDKAAAEFERAKKAFPNNRIVRMYLGEPIAWPKEFSGVEGAPQWAVLQRENLERLADIIRWWIRHRMQPDGQYGGGWGDDCEMWRWWTPVLIAFDDPEIVAAQARFSKALLSQEHMRGGYTNRMTDVEHTAEDSADAITPMMFLDPDNPEWRRRALRLAKLMETLWTGRNERGQLQFKSTYFTADRVDLREDRACDTVYHPRAVQPALLYWQRTGDPHLTRLFADWMDTWVDAAARAERGKPAGVLPSAIHWPDGRVGGAGPNWWDPRNHGEPTLYQWPSAASMMADTLLLTWRMTGRETYLEPLRSMARLRLNYLRHPPRHSPEPGSAMWCAGQLGFLAPTLAKYRLLTGSDEFDELLRRDDGRIPGGEPDWERLAAALGESAEALRVNWPGYTSEVRWTDRVLRFPRLFGEDMMFAEALPHIHAPNPTLIYSMATGDPGDPGYFPLAAVRWRTPPKDVAAMVVDTGDDRFAARLHHFGQQPRSMGAELYLLRPGAYRWRLETRDGPVADGLLTVEGPRSRLAFTLPPRVECRLTIAPRSPLEQAGREQ